MKKEFLLLFLLCAGLFIGAEEVGEFCPDRDGGWIPALGLENGVGTLAVKKDKLTSRRSFLIDPEASYRLSGKFKVAENNAQHILFFGFEVLDAKNRIITSPTVNIFAGTETVLTADLKKGDLTARVKDAARWDRKPYGRVMAFQAQPLLADLPNMNYSPDIKEVRKDGEDWLITFKRPSFSSWKAGTPVRQHFHGAGRLYAAANYRKLKNTDWQEFSATISGIAPSGAVMKQWWKGTHKAKIKLNGTPGIQFKEVRLEKINGKISLDPLKVSVLPKKKDDSLLEKQYGAYYGQLPQALPRPRLFFTEEGFAGLRRILAENRILQEGLAKMLDRFALLPEDISEAGLAAAQKQKLGRKQFFYGKDKWGPIAMRYAFCWKLKGNIEYRDRALKFLRYGGKWYNDQYAAEKSISWTCHSRIAALCAYDWLYPEMSQADRRQIGQALFRHIEQAQNTRWIVQSGMQNKGEGTSQWNSSFYGTPQLKFYAGLVFRKTGINDALAEKYLQEGLKDHLKMLNSRAKIAGADGSGYNSTPGYVFSDGQTCERLFYYAWKSLTGRNIAMDFQANGLLPHWLFYATFPGKDGESLLEHGTGGSWHLDNKVKMNNDYLAHYHNFFPGHPAGRLVDYFIANQPDFRNLAKVINYGAWFYSGYYPWLSFLHNYPDPAKYSLDPGYFRSFPKAFFFRSVGQTYMFSGREKDSTYAMFTCGGRCLSHKQPDENHFVIYKGGFLAMDTGTRSGSGMKNWLDDMWHDNNYNAASIAHNVITIRMEGEKFRGWPDQKYVVANHGGMNRTIGSTVKAFETNDFFTYVSGDSTACYHPGKCRKMLRQFVFVQPDYFVIYDTVESVRSDQPQTWLLHSQNQPAEAGDQFHFDEGEGRLFCRTFLPEGYRRQVIGGPGKEFFSDGKNYPIGPDRIAEMKKKGITRPLWGNWRVELSSGKPVQKLHFLNLIQVGLKKNLAKMTSSELIRDEAREGIRFTAGNRKFTVLFNRDGSGGHIRAEEADGRVILDRNLAEDIQKQQAFVK